MTWLVGLQACWLHDNVAPVDRAVARAFAYIALYAVFWVHSLCQDSKQRRHMRGRVDAQRGRRQLARRAAVPNEEAQLDRQKRAW